MPVADNTYMSNRHRRCEIMLATAGRGNERHNATTSGSQGSKQMLFKTSLDRYKSLPSSTSVARSRAVLTTEKQGEPEISKQESPNGTFSKGNIALT